jgi:PKD repeat protein
MAGQVEVIVIPLPIAYNMTGGGVYFDQPGPGTYCEGSDGVAIGLSKGDLGVNYQLKLNGKDVSVPIQGRGDKISFGYFTEEGVYDIEALSIKGGCFAKMVGSITVKRLPAPTAYDVQSTGGFCEGTAGSEIKLSNSDIGYSYQLFYNGKAQGSSKIGTGSQLSFGLFNKAGAYTVLSTNTSSGCTKMMKGTINLAPVPSPKAFDVSGNGKFCEGDDGAVISLSNSSTNAVYELYNNSIPTGNKLVGTGSELTFTPVNVDGNYSVVATTINGGCSLPMNGIVQVTKVPLPDATITGNKAPGMNTIEKYSIEKPQENETYLWKASNGEIIGSNTAAEITVNWADKKTGTVELYRKNGWGCSNWEILNVDLTNVLTAEFTSKQLKGDVPFLVEFTNNSTGLVSSYLWEFGDGGTSPQVNPSHTYKQVGKYSVKLTISHENDSKTITKADYVTVLPPNSVEEDGQSFNSNKTAGISLIEPNPAKNEIRFDYSLSFDQNIDLAVFDALGNKVLSITSGIVPQGSQNMSVDISKLTSGNYYLQLSTKDGNVTKHFSIVK